ncbi:MAG: DUF499 domain-containing protein [Verrucomicrobiales bacterium]
MLALYHLFSGTPLSELLDVETLADEAGRKSVPKVKRVVLVGNKISPGNPSVKKDGTVVRTLWGELAWQLGGKKAYARIAADDEKATSPGDVLREPNEYGPRLILVDEWVAYARQLHHETKDLPGGDFETLCPSSDGIRQTGEAMPAGVSSSRVRHHRIASRSE